MKPAPLAPQTPHIPIRTPHSTTPYTALYGYVHRTLQRHTSHSTALCIALYTSERLVIFYGNLEKYLQICKVRFASQKIFV